MELCGPGQAPSNPEGYLRPAGNHVGLFQPLDVGFLTAGKKIPGLESGRRDGREGDMTKTDV